MPGRLRVRGQGGRGRAGPGRAPTSWSASAATSRRRPTWPPAGAGPRSWCTRPTRGPGWPTGSAPGSPARVVTAADGIAGLRNAVTSACRCGRRSPRWTGPRRRAEGPRRVRAATRTCRRCSSPAARRARARSTGGSARPAALAAAGVQVLHVVGPRNEVAGADRRRRRPAVRAGAVPGPDGAGLRRGRPGAVPGRGDDLRRADRGRPARRSTCRCRTATASSGCNAEPVVAAGGGADGGRRRADAGVAWQPRAAAAGRPGAAGRRWPRRRRGSGAGTRDVALARARARARAARRRRPGRVTRTARRG